jgi:hypothetical protein
MIRINADNYRYLADLFEAGKPDKSNAILQKKVGNPQESPTIFVVGII